MSLKGLQMKAMIVSDKNLFDVNDKLLEAGKYYFVIDSFGENKTVIGHIVSDHLKNTQYEFRFFSFMTMIIKAQSYLSRRLDCDNLNNSLLVNLENLPSYPSPKKQSKKRISYLKSINQKSKCMICLNDSDNCTFSFNKIKCGHKFHHSCLNEWKNHSNKCPICRTELSI